MKAWFIVLALLTAPAHAQLFMEVGVGQTHFQRIKKDNYWYQEYSPYSHITQDEAWKLGVGYRVSDTLAFTASWLDLGSNSASAWGVHPDEDYYVGTGCRVCDPNHSGDLFTVNSAKGPEFAVVYGREVYLRGGLFLWHHELTARYPSVRYRGTPTYDYQLNVSNVYTESGTLYAPFLGVGLNLGPLFAEVTHYYGLGSAGGYPIAKRATVPMLGVRMEF